MDQVWRSCHFQREVCRASSQNRNKFPYSGMVLAAEATLSLDSFFFIALEAIFIQIFKYFGFWTKVDLRQSKALLSRQPMILSSVPLGQVKRAGIVFRNRGWGRIGRSKITSVAFFLFLLILEFRGNFEKYNRNENWKKMKCYFFGFFRFPVAE